MVVAQKNDGPCLRFLKKVRFEGGERETDLWVHALFEITLVFFFFFLSFLSVFFLIFFLFSLALFLPFTPKICSVFPSPFQGTARPFL